MILHGDCLDKLKELEDNSVGSCVTDPPYELGFMGKHWDNSGIANNPELWKEVLRVLKPGGHLLSFSGTRTYHRQAVAIEDAGFEIRDMVEWVYGSGFPKSLNIGKAVDKIEGNEREESDVTWPDGSKPRKTAGHFTVGENIPRDTKYTKGTSPWEGWGTALKPAHEPICLARKPLGEKTVAQNVLKYGTGGLNIDKSRVGTGTGETKTVNYPNIKGDNYSQGKHEYNETVEYEVRDTGRFPANLIHDGSDEVVREFPNESERFFKSFLYCPKASKSERDRGCEGMEEKEQDRNTFKANEWNIDPRHPDGGYEVKHNTVMKNNHPTVKPLALMKYLIQMITPEGGTVLDPFAGSGSTLVAAKELGYDFIGIEREAEYIKIIEARLNGVKERLL
jgi:site-specific DNA-methyltransferase (adenine-specific)